MTTTSTKEFRSMHGAPTVAEILRDMHPFLFNK